jgi:hypothetical protein
MPIAPCLRLAGCAALLSAPVAAQAIVPLDCKSAFVHVASESPPGAVPLALAPLGLQAGDCVRLRLVGDYDQGPGGDTAGDVWGVFSADATLLAGSQLHRVPGAIDAGAELVTPPTFFGNQPTDVAEDFGIASTAEGTSEVTVEIPAGAQFLFVSGGDSYFSDNSDPDGDFGVELTHVGCWEDLGLGLAGVNGVPQLEGAGTLLAGDALTLALSDARPLASAVLILGLSAANLPFKGGTLVPAPQVLVAGLPIDGTGALMLSGTWPAGLPSGFTLWLQMWIADAAAPHGFSASNGLSASTP